MQEPDFSQPSRSHTTSNIVYEACRLLRHSHKVLYCHIIVIDLSYGRLAPAADSAIATTCEELLF